MEQQDQSSRNIPPNIKQDLSASRQVKSDIVSSQSNLSINKKHRQRVPQTLHSFLQGKLSKQISKETADDSKTFKESKLGSTIKQNLRKAVNHVKKVVICQICQTKLENPRNQDLPVYMSECQHKSSFCQSCLHHYVIYKVNIFEEVHCPHEDCPAMLDIATSFFQSLPLDIQKNYKKIRHFYQTSKDPTLKLCPKQNCHGLIQPNPQNTLFCSICTNSYCQKCLLIVHEGQCDPYQVQFFQSNLRYRQCKHCKFVIEKSQGCNHMKCKCGNQFCYVCGENWTSQHFRTHNQKGQLVPITAQVTIAPVAAEQIQPCFNCARLNEFFPQPIAFLIKSFIKFLLFLVYIPSMLLVFIVRDLILILIMVIVGLLVGMCVYSIQILERIEGYYYILAIMVFPILSVVGVYQAFRDIFFAEIKEIFTSYGDTFCKDIKRICLI